MDREKKHPIAAALAAAADVPITVFADLPEVVLSGGREIRILQHHGVREYTPERIVISGGGMEVEIRGQGLQILCLGPESLAAAGRIDGVMLLRREVHP